MVDLTSTLVSLSMKIGLGVLSVIGIGILFYFSKMGMKWYKKRKTYKIQALIHNVDGMFWLDKIGKFKTNDNIDKMVFLNSGETMPVIDPKYIIANQVQLWRYAPGQYAVVPPRVWGKDPKDFKIDIIDFQMKNFAFLEQRAAVSRWAFIKDLMTKYAPYITVLLILVLGGVAIYFITKMNLSEFNQVIAARMEECTRLVGGGSAIKPPS